MRVSFLWRERRSDFLRCVFVFIALSCLGIGCGSSKSAPRSVPTSSSGGGGGGTTSSCSVTDNTSLTSTVNSYGCYLLSRDTSSCQASRTAQGLSGFWLKISCRVTLTKSGGNVVAVFDSQPDYKTPYFGASSYCYQSFSAGGRNLNPNTIVAQSISMTIPYTPVDDATPDSTGLGVIGVSMNGVSLYNNAAAPGDDIYDEVATFDACEGHPDSFSRYHYHIEPPAISNTDDNFVGVMRDGYPVYGMKDTDGTVPGDLDAYGGHTGVTIDSGGASVYHYHVHTETSGADSANFISAGYFRGTKGTCTGC